MPFTFEFESDEAESVRASRAVTHRMRSVRISYVVFASFFVIGLAGLVSVLIMIRRGDDVGAPFIPFLLVIAGLVGALSLYRAPRVTIRNLRKNNRAALGPHMYVFGGSGFTTKSTGASSTFEWANVPEALETREFILFYISKTWAVMLPKRVVKPEELPAFRAAVRGWVGERAHLQEGPPSP